MGSVGCSVELRDEFLGVCGSASGVLDGAAADRVIDAYMREVPEGVMAELGRLTGDIPDETPGLVADLGVVEFRLVVVVRGRRQ